MCQLPRFPLPPAEDDLRGSGTLSQSQLQTLDDDTQSVCSSTFSQHGNGTNGFTAEIGFYSSGSIAALDRLNGKENLKSNDAAEWRFWHKSLLCGAKLHFPFSTKALKTARRHRGRCGAIGREVVVTVNGAQTPHRATSQ